MDKEKEHNKQIIKRILINTAIVIPIILFFVALNILGSKMNSKQYIQFTKISSLIVLFMSIIIIEISYRKENASLAINGMEILALAFYTLTVHHITNRINIGINLYIIFSLITFVIYYLLKAMLIFTDEKRKFLKSLSDIHEIVSNTPIKKEAQKRNKA